VTPVVIPDVENPKKDTDTTKTKVPVEQNPSAADYALSGSSAALSVGAIAYFVYKSCP